MSLVLYEIVAQETIEALDVAGHIACKVERKYAEVLWVICMQLRIEVAAYLKHDAWFCCFHSSAVWLKGDHCDKTDLFTKTDPTSTHFDIPVDFDETQFTRANYKETAGGIAIGIELFVFTELPNLAMIEKEVDAVRGHCTKKRPLLKLLSYEVYIGSLTG